MRFEQFGSGPAVVLVHGTSGSPEGTWGVFPQELARTHTVITPWLPGSGSSPLPAGPLDPGVIAEQIADVATRAGHERFAVAGNSLGAPLAIEVAARFPARVSALVSVCGYASPRPLLRLREELFAAVLPLAPAVVGKLLLVFGMTDEMAAAMPADGLEAMAEALGSNLAPGSRSQIELAATIDVEARLGSITAPTLLIWGSRDNFVDPAHSRHLAERIPGARCLELDGGHGVVHQHTGAVLAAVREHLRER